MIDHTEDRDDFVVVDRPDEGRFELRRDGETVGFATYRQQGEVITVPHVETHPAHRGRGYGDRLMAGLLDLIAADGRTIVPLCPFAASHIGERPERHRLVATSG